MQQKNPHAFTAAMLFGAAFLAAPAGGDLVGLWQFEGDFTDSSDEGNDGAQQNGVTFVPSQAGYGQAGDFDGSDTHVLVPHDSSLNLTSSGTFAAWVNIDGNSFEGILAKNPSDTGGGSAPNQAGNYELRIENGSRNVTFLYQRGGVNDTHTVGGGGTAQVATSSWQHVAVTINGTGASETILYYLNGSLVATQSGQADGFGAVNSNPLYIGSRADLFTDFHGQLDDVAIFNEVLDVNQINTIKDGDFSAFIVPEPTSLAPLALGLFLITRRRRR